IESIGCDLPRIGEIGKNRRRLIFRIDIQHITPSYTRTESIRVRVVFDFEHVSGDVISMLVEKPLYVEPVDGRTAIESPVIAEGSRFAKRPQPGRMWKALHTLAEIVPIVR